MNRPRCPPRSPARSAARCIIWMSASCWSRAAGWSARPACCSPPSMLAKHAQGSRFVVLDAAMNDLIRPAMYEAWHGIVPVSAVDAVAPVDAGRRGRTGLRIRRHVRARPHAAAAGTRRARGDPRCRRLWFGDEFGLQRAPRGGRGDGGRQRLVGDPRARRATPTCGAPNAMPHWLRMNPPGGDLDRLLRRLAGRRALARSPSCSSASGRRYGRRSVWRACSSAWRCSICRGCCRPGRISACSPSPAADRRAAGPRPAQASPRRTTRPPTAGWRSPPGCPIGRLSVLTDRPSRGTSGPGYRGGRALAGACRPRGALRCAGCASACRGPAWRGAIRAPCAPRWWSPWSPPSRSPARMRPRAWRRRWSRRCRARPPPPATELQAWITPPAYTRLAPIFLKPDGGTVSVPAGARLTVSVTGGDGTPTLSLDGTSEPFRALDKASFQADRDLTEGGHLTVRRDGARTGGLGPGRRRRPAADRGLERPARPRARQPADPAAVARVRRLWRGLAAGRAAPARPARRAAAGGQPAAARRHAEIRAWRQPAGPDGASLGRAAGHRQAGRRATRWARPARATTRSSSCRSGRSRTRSRAR